MTKPVIGISCGVDARDARTRRAYAEAVAHAGGTPILLTPLREADQDLHARASLALCRGLVLTGGDDPSMEEFGEPTHPQANVIPTERQAFELALVRAARERDLPTLGVCLGMQLMALDAGGTLDQSLPDSLPTHADHFDDRVHRVIPEDVTDNPIGSGEVTSWHRQAITDPGRMRVIARAHDGVIEAIDDPALQYFVGVQWHPERTESLGVGLTIFERLVAAAYEYAQHTDQQIG